MTWGMGAGQVLGVLGARRWQAGRAGERQLGGSGAPQLGGSGARGSSGRARQGRAAWAHGLATGYALSALGLFSIRIDSVLFLIRFLDIVREPDS